MKHPGFIVFLAVLTMLSAYPACAEKWIPCGAENQYCDVPGTRLVRYGATDRWATKMVTNGINCGNAAFGDPAPGKVKGCYYQDGAPQDVDRRQYDRGDRRYPEQDGKWTFCAIENQYCKVPGTRVVRYGANGKWTNKTVTRSIYCGNDAFGDPAPGKVKGCYYQDGAPQDMDRRSHDRDNRGYSGQDDKHHHRRWIRCADEGGYCKFHGQKEIRYGVDDKWSTKAVRNGVRCSNDVFGDPAPGASKGCYVEAD